MGRLREVAAPFVVPGPSRVAIRTRLKHLSAADEKVLCLVGDLLGSLAARDLKARCAAGLEHGNRPRIPGPRTRSVSAGHGENAVDQNAQHRSGRSAEHESRQQDSLPLSL